MTREERIVANATRELEAFVEENKALNDEASDNLDDQASDNLDDIQMELAEALKDKEKAQQEVLRIAGEAEKKHEELTAANAELASVKAAYEGLQKSADTMSTRIAELEKALEDVNKQTDQNAVVKK
jgi:predicted nuclease with TOPRIM domain